MEDNNTKELYKKLLKKRAELAESCVCMPYMVATNEALMKIAISKPNDISELRNLKRTLTMFFLFPVLKFLIVVNEFTEGKIERFGTKFLEAIKGNVPKLSPTPNFVVEKSEPSSNLTMLLNEIENQIKSEFIPKDTAVSVIANKNTVSSQPVDDSCDSDASNYIDELSPLSKKQKLNQTVTTNINDSPSTSRSEISVRSYSLLKKRAKDLPPWLKK